MFWRIPRHSAPSRVDSVLDKESFTIEELLDENEILEECKSLNKRLISFLRGKAQVQRMVQYIAEEPAEGTDDQRLFKFPYVCSEIFACEIDVILRTLVENEEMMDTLFLFFNKKQHETISVGYFCKVIICLISRKNAALMRYLQAHQEVLSNLVNLIEFKSIMELLVRLVGGDEHTYTFHADAFQWLADTQLLDLLMIKLSPQNSSEVHSNAAETLSCVSKLTNSALAMKLNTASCVGRLFDKMLEEPQSKSSLIHSLSVCTSLLDPKRAAAVFPPIAYGGPSSTEPSLTANLETIGVMLQRLGDLLCLLVTSADEEVLPTTYGALKPPLGTLRLKIMEFLSTLLRSNSELVRQNFVQLGVIQAALKLFFEYPFHNALHHQVDNLIGYCFESNSKVLIDHILHDCNLVERLLAADEDPFVPCLQTQTIPATPTKARLRIGNIGHLTKIANRIVQASTNNHDLQLYLQEHPKWAIWQSNVLRERNMMENVYQWTCGRPTSFQEQQISSSNEFFPHMPTMSSSLTSLVTTSEIFEEGGFSNSKVGEDHQIVNNKVAFCERDYDIPTMLSEMGDGVSQEGNKADEDVDLDAGSANVLLLANDQNSSSSEGLKDSSGLNELPLVAADDTLSSIESVQAALLSSSSSSSSSTTTTTLEGPSTMTLTCNGSSNEVSVRAEESLGKATLAKEDEFLEKATLVKEDKLLEKEDEFLEKATLVKENKLLKKEDELLEKVTLAKEDKLLKKEEELLEKATSAKVEELLKKKDELLEKTISAERVCEMETEDPQIDRAEVVIEAKLG